MYTRYWNLRESPFLNVDDENLLYPSPQLKEGIARLYYLIDQERTAGMLTGPYGVGKTFLLSCLSRRSKSLGLPLIRFDAIPDGSLPMARHILQRLDIKGEMQTLADALMILKARCMETERKPLPRHILIIDEAQYLTERDGLYLVHYLCNLTIETPKGRKNLFTTILAGTPQLAETVHGYESLQRRVQLSWRLSPLDERQTVEYVQHHMRSAGGDIWSFSQDALRSIYAYTQGTPRNINNLCDTALMLGYAANASQITREIIDEAAIDTCMGPREPDPAPAPFGGI